jgi:hypothetical protein
MILHVICVAYQRVLPLRGLIDSFMNQTDSRWVLHVVHDGPAPEAVRRVMKDPLYKAIGRVYCEETSIRHGAFGHPNRKMMVEKIGGSDEDYILITNDDNYYVPDFVKFFLGECKPDVGLVYCNTLHNYIKYDVLYSVVRENLIDMGSFIVRADIAKKVGFTNTHHSADGRYAEECGAECNFKGLRTVYIDKSLFVHN